MPVKPMNFAAGLDVMEPFCGETWFKPNFIKLSQAVRSRKKSNVHKARVLKGPSNTFQTPLFYLGVAQAEGWTDNYSKNSGNRSTQP